jgi:hypothetical protein
MASPEKYWTGHDAGELHGAVHGSFRQNTHHSGRESIAVNVDNDAGEALTDWTGPPLQEPPNPNTIKERPFHLDSVITNVYAGMTITKVRDIDPHRSSVSCRGFIGLSWDTGHLLCKLDESKLWRPMISFLNHDSMEIIHQDPTYFPSTGWAKMTVSFDGHCSQEFNLRTFPWDFGGYSLLIVADMGARSGNKLTRLYWQESRDVIATTPKYLENQLTEYDLVEQFNQLNRLPFLQDNTLWGRHNTMHFQFFLLRNTWYYMMKICLVILFFNMISWGVFFMHNPTPISFWCATEQYKTADWCQEYTTATPNATATGKRRLGADYKFGEDDEYYYVGPERFAERLSTICEVLLACVAFQYLIDDTIPKMGYLTSMDNLLLTSFCQMALMAVLTCVTYQLCFRGYNELAMQFDWIGVFVIPFFYVSLQCYHIRHAVRIRNKTMKQAEAEAGVHPSMLDYNNTEEDSPGDSHGPTKRMQPSAHNVARAHRESVKLEPLLSHWSNVIKSSRQSLFAAGSELRRRSRTLVNHRSKILAIGRLHSAHRTTFLLPEDEAASKGSEQKSKSKYAESYAEPVGASAGD